MTVEPLPWQQTAAIMFPETEPVKLSVSPLAAVANAVCAALNPVGDPENDIEPPVLLSALEVTEHETVFDPVGSPPVTPHNSIPPGPAFPEASEVIRVRDTAP